MGNGGVLSLDGRGDRMRPHYRMRERQSVEGRAMVVHVRTQKHSVRYYFLLTMWVYTFYKLVAMYKDITISYTVFTWAILLEQNRSNLKWIGIGSVVGVLFRRATVNMNQSVHKRDVVGVVRRRSQSKNHGVSLWSQSSQIPDANGWTERREKL